MGHKNNPWIAITYSIVILTLGCATTKKDWMDARTTDSIQAYEEFLSNHPEGEAADQALGRLEELKWEVARTTDSIASYEEFLRNLPR